MTRTQASAKRIGAGRIGPFLVAVWALTACTKSPPSLAVEPRHDTITIVDTVVVEAQSTDHTEVRGLEQQIAALELKLLERDAQVDEVRQQLDEAIQEVVRTMAKLQSQATRADAASGIAEAEIALQQVETAAGPKGSVELRQVRGLIARSTAEFNKENFGGSLYLANQARGLVRLYEVRIANTGRPEEEQFAVPVPLATTARTNVRSGPGMRFSVLFTLDEGTTILGHAYTTQWVRVETDDGRTGWIYRTLVKRPEPNDSVTSGGR